MAIFSSFSPSSPSPPSETSVVPVKRSGFCDACSPPTPMLRLCLGPDSRRRSEQGSGDYRPGRQVGTRGAGPWGSGVGGLLHIRGQGTRFLTSDQCWLGQGSWVPVIAQGRRTLCRVQRRDPPPGATGHGCRDAQKLIAQNSPARGPGPRHREKVARVSSELHALPRSPAGPRQAGTLHRPQPPGQHGPGSAQSAGESRSVWGCCRGWGASPLPSPPGGDPAGWGAQARRTGSSCGLWGPWRAG